MRARGYLIVTLVLLAACRSAGPDRPPAVGKDPYAGKDPDAGKDPSIVKDEGPPPLPVKKASEEVVVAAWSEPKQLPAGGGQAQILVRAQKRGGTAFPGVEVRVQVEGGTLYSKGKVLLTDAAGRTRDRLTARGPALITVNAGGKVYRFRVPLRAAPDAAESRPD